MASRTSSHVHPSACCIFLRLFKAPVKGGWETKGRYRDPLQPNLLKDSGNEIKIAANTNRVPKDDSFKSTNWTSAPLNSKQTKQVRYCQGARQQDGQSWWREVKIFRRPNWTTSSKACSPWAGTHLSRLWDVCTHGKAENFMPSSTAAGAEAWKWRWRELINQSVPQKEKLKQKQEMKCSPIYIQQMETECLMADLCYYTGCTQSV